MPPKSPEIAVNPRILVWMRQMDGATVEEVADKLGLLPAEVVRLETGEQLPR